MAISFQSVTLDTDYGDSEAILVFRKGRLAAALARLDSFHGELAGRWYVETLYTKPIGLPGETFETPEEFGARLT